MPGILTLFILGFLVVLGYCFYEGTLGVKTIVLITGLIYIYGTLYFCEQVRKHCTHGNCKHGWYSKNNSTQKLEALGWVVGFPLVATYIGKMILKEE